MDYTNFIDKFLSDMGVNYVLVERNDKSNYFKTQNPIIEEIHPSFIIYTDGWCESYNGSINGKNRLHLKEECKITGYLSQYISFILKENNIPLYNFYDYKNILFMKILGEIYSSKKYRSLKKMFDNMYIHQTDILGIDEIKPAKYKKNNRTKKVKSSISIVEITDDEKNQCIEYANNRKIELSDNVIPIKIRLKGSTDFLAIGFKYPDGFMKFRLIDAGLRYLSVGNFKMLYESKIIDNNEKCYVIEGEIEAESFKRFLPYSVYAMHNLNTIRDLYQLEKYNKIIVLIDYDKYNKVEKGLYKQISDVYPNKEIKVLPKIVNDNKNIDFNYLLINDENKLKEIVDKLLEI